MFRTLAVSLLPLVLAGCMTPPTDLDLSLSRTTVQKKYVVAIAPLAEPIVIGKMHSWEVKVTSPAGEPIDHAQIAVGGGMPQHGHGLPTQPRITRELGDGRYLMEGMKFSMPGWWEIKLDVQTASGSDKVTFNKVIALSVPSKPSAY